MNATASQSRSQPAPPDPGFLLPPHLVTALDRLDAEMDRRTRNYDALEPDYRLKRVETDIRLFGRLASARKTILDAHLSRSKASSYRSHLSDAAGVATAKPSGEAGPSTPSTDAAGVATAAPPGETGLSSSRGPLCGSVPLCENSSDAAGVAAAKSPHEAGPSAPSTPQPVPHSGISNLKSEIPSNVPAPTASLPPFQSALCGSVTPCENISLPDPARYLPKMMLDGLLRAETALADLIAHWPQPSLSQDYDSRRRRERRARSSILYDREFEDAVRHLCRAIGIRKSVFDLAHGFGPPPEGFVGWDSDTDRNPFDDPEPPIPPPGCPLPPSPAEVLGALRATNAPSDSSSHLSHRSHTSHVLSPSSHPSDPEGIATAKPSGEAGPSHDFHPSSHPSHRSYTSYSSAPQPPRSNPENPVNRVSFFSSSSFPPSSLPDPFPRPRALRAYSALPKKIFRFLRRFGDVARFFVYMRPWFKNRPVRRLSSAVGCFVADFNPELAYPPDDPGDAVAFAPT